MTLQEADALIHAHPQLLGLVYYDPKKKQAERIIDLIVTPQDHPFFPEFLAHYLNGASYRQALMAIYERHGNDILYTPQCVLEELYDLRSQVPLHVLVPLPYVLRLNL